MFIVKYFSFYSISPFFFHNRVQVLELKSSSLPVFPLFNKTKKRRAVPSA